MKKDRSKRDRNLFADYGKGFLEESMLRGVDDLGETVS
jgi:hypothetical protein